MSSPSDTAERSSVSPDGQRSSVSPNEPPGIAVCSPEAADRRKDCTPKPEIRKATHCIFDLDGLLLDTETVNKKMYETVMSTFGKTYTTELQMKVMGATEVDGANIFIQELELPVTTEELVSKFQEEGKKVLADCELMPGAEDLVRHLFLQHVPIAIATSSSTDSYKLKTSKQECFFSLFHHVTYGGSDPEVKEGKPAPDIFLVCAKNFEDNPNPEDCLVFEDAPNGVAAAKTAGMQVIMVPDKMLDPELCKGATLKLDSLEELKLELFGLPPKEKE